MHISIVNEANQQQINALSPVHHLTFHTQDIYITYIFLQKWNSNFKFTVPNSVPYSTHCAAPRRKNKQ
jgi:hypothetical protein